MSTRRDLLRLAGLACVSGLAGCTAIAGEEPATGPGGRTGPSDRDSPSGATHRISLDASDDPPDLPVRPRVAVADP